MPNPHYQRVLESDEQLWLPVRLLTRAMSSWWTIALLAVYVVGHVALALVPIGGRYAWQSRLLEMSQQQMLSSNTLLAAAIVLAVVVLWSGARRLPWRWENFGVFIAIMGLATIIVTQALDFRSRATAVCPVPVTLTKPDGSPADALSLTYTERYIDPHDRVLIAIVNGSAPIAVPLDHLPRWNDAGEGQIAPQPLNQYTPFGTALGFGVTVTPVAYIADGSLTDNPDGSQTVTPTPVGERTRSTLPFQPHALVALRFTAELTDGSTAETTVWLPFEPIETGSFIPDRAYQIEGVGSVRLAFRPEPRRMPFAMAGGPPGEQFNGVWTRLAVHTADADVQGRLIQPTMHELIPGRTSAYQAWDDEGRVHRFTLELSDAPTPSPEHAIIVMRTGGMNTFVLTGMITFGLGVLLELLISKLADQAKPKAKKSAKAGGDAA